MKAKMLTNLARSLRRRETESEKKLWGRLRSNQLAGMKFRRQLPVGPYIVDFCSLEAMLIIELDGSQHVDKQKEDDKRTKFLETQGFRVIRFWHNEVLTNIEAVLETIVQHLRNSPSPQPSPLKGEGG
jgi:very-short-patch-repair endonuclease